MKLLLDTHTLIWALSDPDQLESMARKMIISPENLVFVSLVSLWELRIKQSIGKIRLPPDFYRKLEPSGFELLSITLSHIEALGKLPLIHRDPFDRMLVTQARCEDLTLVTRDEEIMRYKINCLKA